MALSARQLIGEALAEVLQLDEVEQLLGGVAGFAELRTTPNSPGLDAQPKRDIVEYRHVAEQCVVLEHEANVPLP